MSKNCIYCKIHLDESSVIDVCRQCGLQVWGENMFKAIVSNMENAKETGDLYQGSVTTPQKEKPKMIPFASDAESKFETRIETKTEVVQQEVNTTTSSVSANSFLEETQPEKKEEALTPEKEITLTPEADDAAYIIDTKNSW